MGKSPEKVVGQLEARLGAAMAKASALEGELRQVRNRLARKSEEVAEARQARREALTLLQTAAHGDAALRERVIALLAADALLDAQQAREAVGA